MSSGNWGGAREGAGGAARPETTALAHERTLHERVKRAEREFNLSVRRGEFVRLEAVKQASATLLAIVAQSLRSLPDNLERTMSLAPEVCEAVESEIDRVLSDLAKGLETMTAGTDKH